MKKPYKNFNNILVILQVVSIVLAIIAAKFPILQPVSKCYITLVTVCIIAMNEILRTGPNKIAD